jgi:hypothetical protein
MSMIDAFLSTPLWLFITIAVLMAIIIWLLYPAFRTTPPQEHSQTPTSLPAHHSPLPGPLAATTDRPRKVKVPRRFDLRLFLKDPAAPRAITSFAAGLITLAALILQLVGYYYGRVPFVAHAELSLWILGTYLIGWVASFSFTKNEWVDFPNPWYFWLPFYLAVLYIVFGPFFFGPPSAMGSLVGAFILGPGIAVMVALAYHVKPKHDQHHQTHQSSPPSSTQSTADITEAARKIAEKYK